MFKSNQLLKDQSLTDKMLVLNIIGIASAMGLVLLILSLVYSSFTRNAQVDKLLAEAQLLATNTAPMLAFYDAEEADKLVRAHHMITDLTWIAVFDSHLDIVAELVRVDSNKAQSSLLLGTELEPSQVTHFSSSHLVVTMPIFIENEQVGLVLLESSLEQIQHNILLFILIATSTTLVAIILSVSLIKRQQAHILAPIFDMSKLATQISDGQQYASRVNVDRSGRNEVTQLAEHFNQMLETIESRDRELKSEISQRRKSEQKLDLLARTDLLTSLPNRLAFNTDLDAAIMRQAIFALVFIDLDDFKPVNDKLGHKAGDVVLQVAAKRMLKLLREADSLYRIGGDEFAAIIYDLTQAPQLMQLSQRLIANLQQSMRIGDYTEAVQIGASLGVAFFPEHAQSTEALLHKADLAMYAAKRQGKGAVMVYQSAMDEEVLG